MTKTEGFLLFLTGALVIAWIYTIMQLNKVEKKLSTTSNTNLATRVSTPSQSTSVTASDLSEAIRQKLNEPSTINLNFTK